MGISTVYKLNKAISEGKAQDIISLAEALHEKKISDIADKIIERKNVKAIFFLTGDYAKKETALVTRMIEEGHTLGNHGMTHAKFPELSDSELREEISSLHEYVLGTYGYEMQYLRPPCGEYSEKWNRRANYETD